jgi:DNA polymerase-4
MMMMNWLFMDMNSYFASVEQHLRPELRDREVGVVPVQSEGSCVIAASLGAKRRGIKTGTRVREARQLCPAIVLVKARPNIYVQVHHAILRSVECSAPVQKVYSIDEWAIRLLGEERRPDQAMQLGRQIKRKLLADFSPWLTGSIGIAPTRLLAKIACELKKPDGLVTLDANELPDRLEHLKLTDLPGIAEGMLQRLRAHAICTVRDLWNISCKDSKRIWNSVQGEAWWLGFHGHDEPEPLTHRRSMSHANMLAPEFRNDAGAHGVLVRLLCKAASRLRHHHYYAHRLHVSVRSYGGHAWYDQAPLQTTQDTLTILRQFESLWQKRPWMDQSRFAGRKNAWGTLEKVSITLSGLTAAAFTPSPLFPQEERLRRLSQAMDQLDRRWGPHTVYVGSLHEYRHTMDDKIAFGRIPDVVI